MCELLHRASASKISRKNVASTPTFSLSIGDVCSTEMKQWLPRQVAVFHVENVRVDAFDAAVKSNFAPRTVWNQNGWIGEMGMHVVSTVSFASPKRSRGAVE